MQAKYLLLINLLFCIGAYKTIAQPTNTTRVVMTVDMSEQEVSAEGVFVVGNFFNMLDEPLSDNGDGTWSYISRFSKGETIFYRFKNGTSSTESVTIGGSDCLANDNSGNRILVIPDADSLFVPTVCFNACNGCGMTTSLVDIVEANQVKLAPNPSKGNVFISWKNRERATYQISVLDITGKILHIYPNLKREYFELREGLLLPGMYLISIKNDIGQGILKLIIE